MKRSILPALATAALLAGPAQAQTSSSLTYSDGNQFFELCSEFLCEQTINLNIDTPNVFVTVASGFFDPELDPGLEDLIAPLPSLRIVRINANQFASQDPLTWFFDGVPDDGLASAGVQFDAGSVFNATQTLGPGLIANSNLTWQFDVTKISFGTAGFPTFPAGTVLETASFSINSSRNSLGSTVGAYGVTIQATTPNTSVPGPLGVGAVAGMFAWARHLRRRIKAFS